MLWQDMAASCNTSFLGLMDTMMESEVNFSHIPYPQLDLLHTSWDSR
jgi:hypothetical protein